MNSNQKILKALSTLDAQENDAVMATVVKVEGSAYRRTGARMLIWANGKSVGCISGGCLETEVCKKAAWLTRDGHPAIRRYSTGDQTSYNYDSKRLLEQEIYDQASDQFDDLVDDEGTRSFGLGCNGAVTVLFERIKTVAVGHVTRLLNQVYATQHAGGIAVVIDVPKKCALKIGDRLIYQSETERASGMKDNQVTTELDQLIRVDLKSTMIHKKNSLRNYPVEGGDVEVFFEYLAPPHRLVIFGAGIDAQPLVVLAKQQGWHVTVIDSRSHYAQAIHFPQADVVSCQSLDHPEQIEDQIDGAAIAIMTHSLIQDRHWLGYMLSKSPAYIGQLGPRYRTERLLAEIQIDCVNKAQFEKSLQVLHYPIGLDLGGEGMEAVALSILAEMTAVMNKRSGLMLNERETPIHAD